MYTSKLLLQPSTVYKALPKKIHTLTPMSLKYQTPLINKYARMYGNTTVSANAAHAIDVMLTNAWNECMRDLGWIQID